MLVINAGNCKRFALSAFFVLIPYLNSAAQAGSVDKKFEIFVDGKEYKSFKEYKQSRIDKMQLEVSADNQETASDSKSSSSPAASLTAEMQEHFNKLLEKSGEGESLVFDPSKVKTVEISPQRPMEVTDPQPAKLPDKPEDPSDPAADPSIDIQKLDVHNSK